MRDGWDELERELAAGAICPISGCDGISISFREARVRNSEPWEFKCPRCGVDFLCSEDQVIFQSVPKEWLQAGIQRLEGSARLV
jgi:hypothetical protein